MNAKQVWQTALEQVRTRISEASYTTWFKATEGVDVCPGELTVAAPNSFACEHLRQRFAELAATAASQTLGQPVSVRFVVRGPARRPRTAPPPASQTAAIPPPPAAPAFMRSAVTAIPAAQNPAAARAAAAPRSRALRHERRALLDPPRFASARGHAREASPVAQPALLSLVESSADRLATPAHQSASSPLRDRHVFETFVVGASNRLAFAAAQQIVATPGQSYNPLFIYGGTGLGKTHLLQAIACAARARGLSTCFIGAESFANDMIEAIRHRTTDEFRAQYREVDLLLVDDIHFIAGKEATEEEFFHTFNALHDVNRQIVLASDRTPRAMRHLHDRLRSRFEWGLLADIQPPDEADRLAILRAKLAALGISAPEQVLSALARPAFLSVRELEGALNRAVAHAGMLRRPLDVGMVDQALSPLRMPTRPALSGEAILRAVAEHFGVSLDALYGKGREQRIAWSRQVAMYLLREETAASLAQIGQQLGGRDHTTVMHACAHVARALAADQQTRRELGELRDALRA